MAAGALHCLVGVEFVQDKDEKIAALHGIIADMRAEIAYLRKEVGQAQQQRVRLGPLILAYHTPLACPSPRDGHDYHRINLSRRVRSTGAGP